MQPKSIKKHKRTSKSQIPPGDPNIWHSFEGDVKESHSSRQQSEGKRKGTEGAECMKRALKDVN